MKTFLSRALNARPSLALPDEFDREPAPPRKSSGRVWSPQQQHIFAWFAKAQGNLVVRARAGTGKTTTLLEAITFIPPGRTKILLCAFNKRIQVELASRLADPRAEAKTLHALGFGIVREQWGSVTLDDEVEWDRIDEAVRGIDADLPKDERLLLKKLVSRAKGVIPFGTFDDCYALAEAMPEAAALMPLPPPDDEEEEDHADPLDDPLFRLATLTHAILLASKVPDDESRISFDDMLFVPVANEWASPRYDWVIVDEAQDMNPTQLLLAQASCKPGGHLVFVGDDKQAIYGFRGADSGCLDRLKAKTHATELGLTTTYRCPKAIVAEAQRLVPDFFAAATAPVGEVRSMPHDALFTTLTKGDVVLSRLNAPLLGIALRLLANHIPAQVAGRDIGKGLQEIVKKVRAKDLTEFFPKLVAWHKNRIDRLVAGKKGSGAVVEKKLDELADRVACIRTIAESVDSLPALSTKLDVLFQDRDNRASVVTCSSIHKSKGLEWPRVFLLVDSLKTKWVDPELANIEYVAITRAQETLILVRGGL